MQLALSGVYVDGSGSLQPSVQPVTVPGSTTVTLSLTVKVQSGAAKNLTGYAVIFTARRNTKPNTGTALSVQGVIDNAVAGLCHVTIMGAAMEGLRGGYDYDVTVVAADGTPDQIIPVSPFFISDALYVPGQQVGVFPEAPPLGQGPAGPAGPASVSYSDATRPAASVSNYGTTIWNTSERVIQRVDVFTGGDYGAGSPSFPNWINVANGMMSFRDLLTTTFLPDLYWELDSSATGAGLHNIADATGNGRTATSGNSFTPGAQLKRFSGKPGVFVSGPDGLAATSDAAVPIGNTNFLIGFIINFPEAVIGQGVIPVVKSGSSTIFSINNDGSSSHTIMDIPNAPIGTFQNGGTYLVIMGGGTFIGSFLYVNGHGFLGGTPVSGVPAATLSIGGLGCQVSDFFYAGAANPAGAPGMLTDFPFLVQLQRAAGL